jgi:hypothetical protein
MRLFIKADARSTSRALVGHFRAAALFRVRRAGDELLAISLAALLSLAFMIRGEAGSATVRDCFESYCRR